MDSTITSLPGDIHLSFATSPFLGIFASSVAHSRLIRLYNDRSASSPLPLCLSLSPNLDLGQDVCDPVVAHAVCSAERSDREVNTLTHLVARRGCMRRKRIAEDRGHTSMTSIKFLGFWTPFPLSAFKPYFSTNSCNHICIWVPPLPSPC